MGKYQNNHNIPDSFFKSILSSSLLFKRISVYSVITSIWMYKEREKQQHLQGICMMNLAELVTPQKKKEEGRKTGITHPLPPAAGILLR